MPIPGVRRDYAILCLVKMFVFGSEPETTVAMQAHVWCLRLL